MQNQKGLFIFSADSARHSCGCSDGVISAKTIGKKAGMILNIVPSVLLIAAFWAAYQSVIVPQICPFGLSGTAF
jgi:hypothetical protein